ncbi:hypothetical protein EZV62_018370 [Acer yangbiense]|uniref:Uncharacterized protein n=1 Tax=Acer yangbiense TaxID=1000413 RepID=A0A5C7HJ62_9ROSI|nr:hypothetical protein EZV62_018370 [Acer yangbiense]
MTVKELEQKVDTLAQQIEGLLGLPAMMERMSQCLDMLQRERPQPHLETTRGQPVGVQTTVDQPVAVVIHGRTIRIEFLVFNDLPYWDLLQLGCKNIRRLSPAEQADRHSKGLCFNCDEQFKPGHHCQKLQLLLLEVEIFDEKDQIQEVEPSSEVEISIHALTGFS